MKKNILFVVILATGLILTSCSKQPMVVPDKVAFAFPGHGQGKGPKNTPPPFNQPTLCDSLPQVVGFASVLQVHEFGLYEFENQDFYTYLNPVLPSTIHAVLSNYINGDTVTSIYEESPLFYGDANNLAVFTYSFAVADNLFLNGTCPLNIKGRFDGGPSCTTDYSTSLVVGSTTLSATETMDIRGMHIMFSAVNQKMLDQIILQFDFNAFSKAAAISKTQFLVDHGVRK